MRKLTIFAAIAVLATAAVFTLPHLVDSGSSNAAAPTKTAQSIMINFTAAGTYSVHQNETYKFNTDSAATYFTNAWDGVAPTSSCGGPGCSSTSTPAAPTAPAADAPKLNPGNIGNDGHVGENRCTFLDGGNLSSTSYQQTATTQIGTGGSRATFTFTYNYVIEPVSNPVAPFTAWDLVNSSGSGSAHVPVGAFIAGESVITSNQHPRKYSFSLRDDLGLSRIVNLNVNVDGVDYPATSTLIENAPGALAGDPGALDFMYTGNAGSNGTTSLLVNGNARTILNTDSFNGNQNGGADGRALAAAIMDTLEFDLAPGTHTVTLTGLVKGNTASANLPISVTATINVITPGCGGN